jgi:hypothetical protein
LEEYENLKLNNKQVFTRKDHLWKHFDTQRIRWAYKVKNKVFI